MHHSNKLCNSSLFKASKVEHPLPVAPAALNHIVFMAAKEISIEDHVVGLDLRNCHRISLSSQSLNYVGYLLILISILLGILMIYLLSQAWDPTYFGIARHWDEISVTPRYFPYLTVFSFLVFGCLSSFHWLTYIRFERQWAGGSVRVQRCEAFGNGHGNNERFKSKSAKLKKLTSIEVASILRLLLQELVK